MQSLFLARQAAVQTIHHSKKKYKKQYDESDLYTYLERDWVRIRVPHMKRWGNSESYQDHGMDLIGSHGATTLMYQLWKVTSHHRMPSRYTRPEWSQALMDCWQAITGTEAKETWLSDLPSGLRRSCLKWYRMKSLKCLWPLLLRPDRQENPLDLSQPNLNCCRTSRQTENNYDCTLLYPGTIVSQGELSKREE